MSDSDIKYIIEQSKKDGPRSSAEIQALLNKCNTEPQTVNCKFDLKQYITKAVINIILPKN